jgi:hypothetical protein
MRIASITMIGQFPDGIDLHARNLRWALSETDHICIVTRGSFIEDYDLRSDDRITYIDFSKCNDIREFLPFWKEFPRVISDNHIDPEWFLFMEQDIWFYEKIKDDPLPDSSEIRGHIPLHETYHCVMVAQRLCHPRVWEASMLVPGPVVRRAIGFGVDFSAHPNWFTKRNKEYWDNVAGGTISLGDYQHWDTMDEFTLYCALVENTRATYCPRAAHLQGPEALHRSVPEVYNGVEGGSLYSLTEHWNSYCCVHTAAAMYFIAGNWKQPADWNRIQRRYRPEFEKLSRRAHEWMKPDEYERLERIVAGFQSVREASR